MQLHFSYDKKKVIQALRLHFTSQKEIRILTIAVNVFAIASAVLFYLHKIQPQPFLIGSLVWLLILVAIWYVLPYSIYKKSSMFNDSFTASIDNKSIRLDNEKGYVNWEWNTFIKHFESPLFFHLYFSQKSFFLLPKDNITDDILHELRSLLNEKIKK